MVSAAVPPTIPCEPPPLTTVPVVTPLPCTSWSPPDATVVPTAVPSTNSMPPASTDVPLVVARSESTIPPLDTMVPSRTPPWFTSSVPPLLTTNPLTVVDWTVALPPAKAVPPVRRPPCVTNTLPLPVTVTVSTVPSTTSRPVPPTPVLVTSAPGSTIALPASTDSAVPDPEDWMVNVPSCCVTCRARPPA